MSGLRLFPRKNVDFYIWADNFRQKMQSMPIATKLDFPPLAAQILSQNWQTFSDIHTKYIVQQDKSPAITAQYRYYRQKLSDDIRTIYDQFVRFNTNATPDIRITLGFHVPDTVKTQIVMTTAAPHVSVEILSDQRVKLIVKADDKHRAKPNGADGYEIRVFVGTNPPMNPDEYIEVLKATKSFTELDYSFEEIGKCFWYITRWYGTRGQQGAWSKPVAAIIN